MTNLNNSDFKLFVQKNRKYYVDKTMLIDELLTGGNSVMLFPRPRGFGKTLNFSMLKYYFDIREDSRELFKGLKIEKSEVYEKHLNKYPTIFITFKDVKGSSWKEMHISIKAIIKSLYEEHKYLLDSDKLEKYDKKDINDILNGKAHDSHYKYGLQELSKYMREHYGERVVILFEDYDILVNKNLLNNEDYEDIMRFLQSMMSSAFKGNEENLFMGLTSGILRIPTADMFGGANNIDFRTILDNGFSDRFGFTEDEVIDKLKQFNLEDRLEEVKNWYGGYKFGKYNIYNPYSITSFLQNSEKNPKNYWLNLEETSFIKNLLINGVPYTKEILRKLIKDNEISRDIKDVIQPREIKDYTYIWSFLLYSGYLTCLEKKEYFAHLKIPNEEVKECYILILKGFLDKVVEDPLKIINAVKEGDTESLKGELSFFSINKLSIQNMGEIESLKDIEDKEKVEDQYNTFLLSLPAHLYNEYDIDSDEKSREGEYLISIIPKNKDKIGYVIKINQAKYKKDMKKIAELEINQIKDKSYDLMRKEIKDIIFISIVFKGKDVYSIEKKLSEIES